MLTTMTLPKHYTPAMRAAWLDREERLASAFPVDAMAGASLIRGAATDDQYPQHFQYSASSHFYTRFPLRRHYELATQRYLDTF